MLLKKFQDQNIIVIVESAESQEICLGTQLRNNQRLTIACRENLTSIQG